MSTLSSSELARAAALLAKGDWQAVHKIVQQDEESALACWAHGIVHLMEGDLSNARYWYREAKRPFPKTPAATQEIEQLAAALRGQQDDELN